MIAGSDESLRRLFLLPLYQCSFVLEIEERVVYAISHLRRRPNFWKRRLKHSKILGRPVDRANERRDCLCH